MTCVLIANFLLGLSFGCSAQEPAKAGPPAAVEPKQPAAQLTEAERIAQTERLLDAARKDLEQTKKDIDDPDSDYTKAEAAFKKLDGKLSDAKKAVAKLRADNMPDEATKAETVMKPLVADWEQARDRFNLAITQRKALQAKQTALAAQIAKYEQALAALKQPNPPPTPKTDPPPVPKTDPPVAPEPKKTDPVVPIGPGVPGVALPKDKPPETPPKKVVPDDAEIRNARAFADGRRAALAEAENKAKSVEERVQVLTQLITTEQGLLAAERKVADQAEGEATKLTQQLAAADPVERTAILPRLAEANLRLAKARDRIAALSDRLTGLNADLQEVQDERIQAMKLIEDKRKEADDANRELERLQNPLSTRNINKWLASHGLNMALIVIGVVSLHVVVRLSSRRIVRFVARNSNRGSEEDRENRASTLVGVFRYATTLVIFGGGIVMLLDEAGVPIVPLMGGAAVVGLAVAFGAQNLIKDYFTGFMMLLEDQYGVNDVVKIGTIAGKVERITLRMTVLRDLEGVLHFVPHGQVTAVSNMTHGWSRAMFDIPVPHTANLDRLMEEFVRLGVELRADPNFATKIVEDPEMLGVETLDATASMVRFLVKTRPLQQWAVKRELLRRIKLRLDQLGVEIPAPRRTFEMVFADTGNGKDQHPPKALQRFWPEERTGT